MTFPSARELDEGDLELVALATRTIGVNLYHFTGGPCAELSTIVAVGDSGRGILAPCGRDRQVLSDYHPDCRVLIPTPEGPRSVLATDLLPGAYRAPGAV